MATALLSPFRMHKVARVDVQSVSERPFHKETSAIGDAENRIKENIQNLCLHVYICPEGLGSEYRQPIMLCTWSVT